MGLAYDDAREGWMANLTLVAGLPLRRGTTAQNSSSVPLAAGGERRRVFGKLLSDTPRQILRFINVVVVKRVHSTGSASFPLSPGDPPNESVRGRLHYSVAIAWQILVNEAATVEKGEFSFDNAWMRSVPPTVLQAMTLPHHISVGRLIVGWWKIMEVSLWLIDAKPQLSRHKTSRPTQLRTWDTGSRLVSTGFLPQIWRRFRQPRYLGRGIAFSLIALGANFVWPFGYTRVGGTNHMVNQTPPEDTHRLASHTQDYSIQPSPKATTLTLLRKLGVHRIFAKYCAKRRNSRLRMFIAAHDASHFGRDRLGSVGKYFIQSRRAP
ncbi:hypothetical protein B0J18DRAFT_303470 [Chaetomium sp. MPI-SDFR-AT-0129]|nr:hypothetical protein B0J18DRAFT_303470 [Chaetomium sp. MPI-SDFR-AT-0129]